MHTIDKILIRAMPEISSKSQKLRETIFSLFDFNVIKPSTIILAENMTPSLIMLVITGSFNVYRKIN